MTDEKSQATQSGTRWWLTLLFVMFLLTGMAALLGMLIREWLLATIMAVATILYCAGLILYDLVIGLWSDDSEEISAEARKEASGETSEAPPPKPRRRRILAAPSRGQHEGTVAAPPFVRVDKPIVLSRRVKILIALLALDFVLLFVGLLTGFWIPAMIGGAAFALGALIVMWLASRPERA